MLNISDFLNDNSEQYNSDVAPTQQVSVTDIDSLFRMHAEKFVVDCYQIVNHLASGGEANVFLAYDLNNHNAKVAILDIKSLQDANNRIHIHSIVNDLEGTVKLLKVIRTPGYSCSYFPNRIISYYSDIIQRPSTLLVTNYFPGETCIYFLRKQSLSRKILFFLRLVELVYYLHELGVFHFDLKPDNILTSAAGDFCLLDFGSAQYLDQQHINIVDPLIAVDQPTSNIFKFTPKYAPSVPCDIIIAEKFDVFSLGCILYQSLTGNYCPGAFYRHYRDFIKLVNIFGPLITDLLAGMLDADQTMRYSVTDVLNHPAFLYSSLSEQQYLLLYHTNIILENRDVLYYNCEITSLLRPHTIDECRNIARIKDKKFILQDDMNRLKLQALIRRYNFAIVDDSSVVELSSEALLNLNYYYSIYSDIKMCASNNNIHTRFLKFLRFLERDDYLKLHLLLFRYLIFDSANFPDNRSFQKGSFASRTSRQSTVIKEMFRKSYSLTDETEVQRSVIEWSIESDGNLIQTYEGTKKELDFKISLPITQALFGANESSEQFCQRILPPAYAPLDDLFTNYENIDIEISSSQIYRTNEFLHTNQGIGFTIKKVKK